MDDLRLVVGLGNPGFEYSNTRHNVGFLIIDRFLGRRRGFDQACGRRFRGEFIESRMLQGGARLPEYWLKPMTFMNLSGDSVSGCLRSLQVAADRMLVIHDDLDLDVGRTKIKFAGGDGGHNGLRSITETIGSDAYWRLRIGIGKPPEDFAGDGADWVLSEPPAADLERSMQVGVEGLNTLVRLGCEKAMQQINRRKAEETGNHDG